MDKETAERLVDVMAVDPIAEFEIRSGKSYKDNDNDENLLMLRYAMYQGQIKAEALSKRGDVCWGLTVGEYIERIVGFGFEQVLCDDFTSEKHDQQDKFFIFWNPKGLLLAFDTFGGDSINSGKVYYNWRPQTGERFRYTSSGSYCDGIWVGDHDCREGLIANMTAMESAGEFLPVWWHSPRLWLLSYADHEHCCAGPINTWTHKEVTGGRIARLPKHVQDAIRGQKTT